MLLHFNVGCGSVHTNELSTWTRMESYNISNIAFAAGEKGELRQEVKELTGRMTEMTKAELAKKWKENALDFQN